MLLKVEERPWERRIDNGEMEGGSSVEREMEMEMIQEQILLTCKGIWESTESNVFERPDSKILVSG
jgi:hypothetical protein